MDEQYTPLSTAIFEGDEDEGVRLCRQMLDDGVSPLDIFAQCVEPTLNNMGDLFAKLEIFLPDLVVAGQVVGALQDLMEPVMKEQNLSGAKKPRAVIATVNGDIHDIGKNMVTLMMQVNGFEMCDLGVDVPPVAIVKKAEEVDADLVCLSGLMLPSLPYMRETINLVKQNANLQRKVRVMVGGGPVTREWAANNGADGYSDDAIGAVQPARQLTSQ